MYISSYPSKYMVEKLVLTIATKPYNSFPITRIPLEPKILL